MNVYYCVVLIYFTSLFVLSAADDGKPVSKRILKLKNVNYNKTAGKPKSQKKHQKNKTLFVLSNPVVYPQKLIAPKPTDTVLQKPTNHFDILNFDAYILKPRNINYTALLSNSNTGGQEKETTLPEPTTHYPPIEFLDFARAEPLIQTTLPTTVLETVTYEPTSHKSVQPEIKQETTTAKINSFFPLGLAYFDSLRKYRKAFDSLRKRERTKKPRIKTTTPSTTTTTTTSTTAEATETVEPFIETTTAKEFGYGYVATPNYDEDLYEEPHFESYRYKPRYHHNFDDEYEKIQYEATTRSLDYEPLDRHNNNYEPIETVTTTTRAPKNSSRRKSKKNNSHSANVKSNFLYDGYINFPQEDESRRIVSVAKVDEGRRRVRNDTEAVDKRSGGADGAGGTRGTDGSEAADKKHKNTIPMQRHYFQYVNAINDGAYNAGVGKGNQNHYIEQHELSVPKNGTFQKRVRWNDKKGGFGELYYDLNHH